ncbi:hypothetical protein Barb4_03201 [Bacteroidales bacterium Barb4]|nr:hypothetical protein Barb4_03201 [Bacteroidales bacterium Barb4]
MYYAEGALHLVNLAGYSISVSTMKEGKDVAIYGGRR